MNFFAAHPLLTIFYGFVVVMVVVITIRGPWHFTGQGD